MALLSDALDSFRCYLDKDIETFLRSKATDFISRGWCSVYLLVDEQSFDAGHIKIEAYFTLSHKVLMPIASVVSKSLIKDASGSKGVESIHFVLIGQLGKHMEGPATEGGRISGISSSEILDKAFEVIRAAHSLIPCRCALVECSDNEKIHTIYENNGFKFFQFDGTHYQYYKRIV